MLSNLDIKQVLSSEDEIPSTINSEKQDSLIEEEIKSQNVSTNKSTTSTKSIPKTNMKKLKKIIVCNVKAKSELQVLKLLIKKNDWKNTTCFQLFGFDIQIREDLKPYSYQSLPCEQQIVMDSFMKIFRIYSWASGLKFKDQLTSSKFIKLASLQTKGVFLEKVDFELLFTKLTKCNSNLMDFQDFINAIGILTDAKFPRDIQENQELKVMAMITDFVSVINRQK